MKKNNMRKYYIRSSNTHLLNVLEDNYYIEIGIISLNKIDKLLHGQVLDLAEFIYFDTLNEGIGKITNDASSDVYFQLNFLLSYRQKVSTSKFFLTCGLIKYRDEEGLEKFAPVILIPIDIDYQKGKIKCSSEPIVNRLLLKLIAKIKYDTQDEQNKYIESLVNTKFVNVSSIDRFCIELSENTKLPMIPNNYLTVCNVEYYDFFMQNNYFSPERSIYEKHPYQIYREYFQNIKAVFPTNIYQKHVLLKAHNGESFGVDGRLGSGKTYTALNIMADFIAQDKKVLYINQDLDNIWDVERNLRYLNLNNYFHNLSIKTKDIEVKPVILPEVTEFTFNYDPINFFAKLDEEYGQKICGFDFEYLIENLAIIKRVHQDIKEITVETNLERHEYEYVCQELDIIEDLLQEVDDFEKNVWRNLQTSYNNISAEDIEERTKKFYDLQKVLCKQIDDFCKEYKINEPKNIHDLYRLIEDVMSFGIAKPQLTWKDNVNRIAAKKSLTEIASATDENYFLQNYYKLNIDERYVPGRMLEILEIICGKHLSLTDDQIYINRLLSTNTKLHSISDSISKNIETTKKCYDNLKTYFNIKEFNQEEYQFLSEIGEYLSNNRIPRAFVKEYVNDITRLLTIGEKVEKAWRELNGCKSQFKRFVLPAIKLGFEEITDIINNKKAKKIIQKYLDKNLMHQNKLDKEDVMKIINNYYVAGSTLKSLLPVPIEKYEYEKYWEEVVNLYRLVQNNPNTIKYLQFFLKNQLSNESLGVVAVVNTLKTFKDETINTISLITQLKNYHIQINEEEPTKQLAQLEEWNKYLINVINLKNEISVIFIKLNHISLKDVIELIEIDKRYIELSNHLKENDKNYHRLLGDNYKKFDTVISDIGQSLEHFDDFIERVKNPKDIDDLLSNPTFDEFLADARKLRDLHTSWISHYRLFSVCFQKGQSELHQHTFKEVLDALKGYYDKAYQISRVTRIITSLDRLNKYGLNHIITMIRNGELTKQMSARVGFTLMHRYLELFYAKAPILSDFNWIKEQFSAYEKAERDYCTRNIQSLVKNINKRPRNKNSNIPFYEYNRFIETTIKNTNVYLADLGIFNNDIDLSVFDLVIIDDGHLSSANKYSRIMECKQVIIFGDKLFKSSVANSLMQRINEAYLVSYNTRYTKMTPKFNNEWTNNNRYIYASETPVKVHSVENVYDFAERVVEYYKKNTLAIINVLIGNDITRREVYETIVKLLQVNYSAMEIVEILCYHIRIINANEEGSRYVNDVFVYYTDFLAYEKNVKSLMFKNFVVVDNSVQIYYSLSKNEEDNKAVVKDINSMIAKTTIKTKKIEGITTIFLNDLKEHGINAMPGFGKFDIMYQNNNNYAIIFEGCSSTHTFSIIDDYQYYYRQYLQRGWKIKIIYVHDLIDNYDSILESTIDFLNGESDEK